MQTIGSTAYQFLYVQFQFIINILFETELRRRKNLLNRRINIKYKYAHHRSIS